MQRYSYDLVFTPGSKLILHDTLSRACPPNNSDTYELNEFPEELIALIDEQQLNTPRMVASQRTIDMIRAAADDDPIYQQLKEQIADEARGRSTRSTPVRDNRRDADELVEGGGFRLQGTSRYSSRSAR